MRTTTVLIAASLMMGLSACGSERGDTDAGEDVSIADGSGGENAEGGASEEEPVSILRSDIEQPEVEAPLEPLNATIGFPNGGADLSEEALAALKEVLASEQVARGLPIVLRAHSDAGGSDAVNERASQARGLAVAAWLIENGIADDRIRVIVFGEQNPIEPNALPNGAPNEAGRAANRRVEVLVGSARRAPPPEAAAD